MSLIRVSTTGHQELSDSLQKFAGNRLDLTRSMGAMSIYLNRFFAGEMFVSRGQAAGKPWPKLNDNYAAWKARRFPGRPPLIRSGLMNRSYRHKSTALSTSLWNEADYFEIHQEGIGVPQRQTMVIDEQRELRIVKYVISDLTTQMNDAGLL